MFAHTNGRYTAHALALTTALLFGGCTSVQVDALKQVPAHICIEENPKVMVSDFVPVLREGFARYGIDARPYAQIPRAECPYVLTYSARRSWDFAPYLSQAELRIVDAQRRTVASAEYHLVGKGGFSLMKWQGTKAKMDPVIDKLLVDTQVMPAVLDEPAAVPTTPVVSYEERLRALQQEPLSYQQYQERVLSLKREYGRD